MGIAFQAQMEKWQWHPSSPHGARCKDHADQLYTLTQEHQDVRLLLCMSPCSQSYWEVCNAQELPRDFTELPCLPHSQGCILLSSHGSVCSSCHQTTLQ